PRSVANGSSNRPWATRCPGCAKKRHGSLPAPDFFYCACDRFGIPPARPFALKIQTRCRAGVFWSGSLPDIPDQHTECLKFMLSAALPDNACMVFDELF